MLSTKKGGENEMAETIFMKVDEVAQKLEVSKSYAYRLMQEMNRELKSMGCITISGRIDRQFFYDKLYGTRNTEKEKKTDGSI